MKNKKVLIIDDDPDILEATRLFLSRKGFFVESYETAKNFEYIIKSFQPDIILLDILLPDILGTDVCLQLKTRPNYKNIPVIIIAAHPNIAKLAKKCRADGFLEKPFETSALLQTLKSHL
jgi:DNA-binding response OmpR family regulator